MSSARPPVFVLGHRGMLGHVAARWFAERGHDVRTTDARYGAGARDPLVEAVRDSDARWVLNCLGRIKQKSADAAELYRSNTLLPLQLGSRLRPDQHLVHASSDCVFSGARGGYRADEPGDADDIYGVSKLLGEAVNRAPNATVVRVSIIGPELGDGRGLMGWFVAQPTDRPVSGFTDHRWNGITTLEWARFVGGMLQALARGARPAPLMQPGTDAISKHELLLLLRDVFATGHEVRAVASGTRVDRTLVPDPHLGALRPQLEALRDWYAPAPVAAR